MTTTDTTADILERWATFAKRTAIVIVLIVVALAANFYVRQHQDEVAFCKEAPQLLAEGANSIANGRELDPDGDVLGSSSRSLGWAMDDVREKYEKVCLDD